VVINSKFILASRQTPAEKFKRAGAGKAMPETAKEPRLPENVSQLRQKLGQKAKQEPKDLRRRARVFTFWVIRSGMTVI
jgi:hypothetical protein